MKHSLLIIWRIFLPIFPIELSERWLNIESKNIKYLFRQSICTKFYTALSKAVSGIFAELEINQNLPFRSQLFTHAHAHKRWLQHFFYTIRSESNIYCQKLPSETIWRYYQRNINIFSKLTSEISDHINKMRCSENSHPSEINFFKWCLHFRRHDLLQSFLLYFSCIMCSESKN